MSDSTTDDPNVDGKDDPEQRTEPRDDRWLSDEDVLAAPLPADLAAGLGRVLGDDRVGTIGEWIRHVRQYTGGGAIDIADLCHADDETAHRGRVDGETYHFRCFYDAAVLAALADDPVDIRTVSPDGVEITAKAIGTSALTVEPPDAVFSFGIARAVEPPSDAGPSHADIYAAVCPYVKAFPDRAAYERWAGRVAAATVAMPLTGATEIAGALVD